MAIKSAWVDSNVTSQTRFCFGAHASMDFHWFLRSGEQITEQSWLLLIEDFFKILVKYFEI